MSWRRGPTRGLAAFAVWAATGAAAAIELPVTGAIAIHIGALPPFIVVGAGVAEVSVDESERITRIDMPAHLLATSKLIVPVTDPRSAPIRGIAFRDFANATGIFERNEEGQLAGSMPLEGVLRVCLFSPCSAAIANISVPLAAIGHSHTSQVSAAVALTVRGAPWAPGTVPVGSGSAIGSQAGLDLNLVTPVLVSTNIAASPVVPTHGVLSLSFGSPGSHCQNQLDDDLDGAADFPNDPGCASAEDPSERTEGAPCDNGLDDDGDRRIDAGDPGCADPLDTSERADALPCDDTLDNDGDGYADEDDPGCASPRDSSERGTLACDDGIDTDGDGLADPQDPGCTDAFDDSEREAGLPCDDGLDDDRDGALDFPDDTGCASIQDPSERSSVFVCDDGIDNDRDGRNDFEIAIAGDPGCSSRTDTSERSPTLACDDALDNDFDGAADVPDDPGCAAPSDSSEQSFALACDNGLDDDGDGAIDSQQDPGCADPADPREAIDFSDGKAHAIGAENAPGDGIHVDDDGATRTRLYLNSAGVIAGDLTVASISYVRMRGGSVTGSVVGTDQAEIEILGGEIGGRIEARDGSIVTIAGSGFDLPFGAVDAMLGTITGFLSDGSLFAWDFVREPGAAIVLSPEPDTVVAALLAIATLVTMQRRAKR